MNVEEVVTGAREALTVRRVFGEPFEKNGTTVIPVAKIRGGAGGGQGDSSDGTGGGTGFGLTARPVGAYVIRDGDVRWEPAFDLTRIVIGGQLLLGLGLLVYRSRMKRRLRYKRYKLKKGD